MKAGKPYYGYKLHLATDLNYGFIVVRKVTSANRSDTKEIIPFFAGLVSNDLYVIGIVLISMKKFLSCKLPHNIIVVRCI